MDFNRVINTTSTDDFYKRNILQLNRELAPETARLGIRDEANALYKKETVDIVTTIVTLLYTVSVMCNL